MRFIKSSLIAVMGISLVLFAWAPLVHAQKGAQKGASKSGSCSPGQVWEQPHVKTNGQMAPGFCRPATRAGFKWEAATKGPDGKLRRGQWVPAGKPPANQEWVRGSYDQQGNWVEGHYVSRREGAPAGGIFGTQGSGSERKGTERRGGQLPFGSGGQSQGGQTLPGQTGESGPQQLPFGSGGEGQQKLPFGR